MANTDKLLLICIILMIVGFSVAIFDVQRTAYNKGVRDGYHRGRALKEGTPSIIAVPSDFVEVKE
jgi:F0F1-type ATP synthase assembly protein I